MHSKAYLFARYGGWAFCRSGRETGNIRHCGAEIAMQEKDTSPLSRWVKEGLRDSRKVSLKQ
jgi:hypothetical protein